MEATGKPTPANSTEVGIDGSSPRLVGGSLSPSHEPPSSARPVVSASIHPTRNEKVSIDNGDATSTITGESTGVTVNDRGFSGVPGHDSGTNDTRNTTDNLGAEYSSTNIRINVSQESHSPAHGGPELSAQQRPTSSESLSSKRKVQQDGQMVSLDTSESPNADDKADTSGTTSVYAESATRNETSQTPPADSVLRKVAARNMYVRSASSPPDFSDNSIHSDEIRSMPPSGPNAPPATEAALTTAPNAQKGLGKGADLQRGASDTPMPPSQQQHHPRHARHDERQQQQTQLPHAPHHSQASSMGSIPQNAGSVPQYFKQGQNQQNLKPQRQQQQTAVPSQHGTVSGGNMQPPSGVGGAVALPNSPQGQHDIVEKSPGGRYVRFLEKLGSGAYKDVYRAYDTIEGIEVAWNVVNLSGVPKNERLRIVNEVRLLERLHHPNIISFHGSWVNRELEQVIFVTEILSSGTLKSFINKVQVIRWKIAKRWAVQILKGLDYLHSHDPPIIHRDLKCDNIFINGTSGDLRIGDLGLSTVISNKNKVLSVLGTPEFMAPELYDEAYDEKVDIYAFGMCLLEIFTKEIPYSECANPAQIYKKVTKRIEPASLRRVRSGEAREFIMLCLGSNDTRPSASDLLKHPFLAKGVDDDSVVEVDPPMRENTIAELPASGGLAEETSESATFTVSTRGPSDGDLAGGTPEPPTVSADSTEAVSHPNVAKVQGGEQQRFLPGNATVGRELPTQPLHPVGVPAAPGAVIPGIRHANHYQEPIDESNLLNGMPDSETNIKKVKVLMGRGHELEEDEDLAPPKSNALAESQVGTSDPKLSPSDPEREAVQTGHSEPQIKRSDSGSGNSDPGAAQLAESQFLVAAAVVEGECAGDNPYEDDILNLIITLPVDGQTQNVQFDFHLVTDDPVQVAREMVTELHIPQNAVLEISETISGLARAARIKQGRFNQQMRQQQQHQQIMGQQQVVQRQALPPQQQQSAGAPVIEASRNQPPADAPIGSSFHAGQPQPTPTQEAPMPLPQASVGVFQQQHPHQPLAQTAGAPLAPKVQQGVNMPIVAGPPVKEASLKTAVGANSSGAMRPSAPRESAHVRQTASGAIPEKPLANVSVSTEERKMDSDHSSSDDESDDSNSEELRRLEEDYQKNLLRAKKAFYTRMDNLQRSKEEREAQHLKTLEKHEKEKIEFEKRLKQAEAEQNRRLEQLEKDWARQRETAVARVRQGREGGRLADHHPKEKRKQTTQGETGGAATFPGSMQEQSMSRAAALSQRSSSKSPTFDISANLLSTTSSGPGVTGRVNNGKERIPSLASRQSAKDQAATGPLR